jgi:hypothetical protein
LRKLGYLSTATLDRPAISQSRVEDSIRVERVDDAAMMLDFEGENGAIHASRSGAGAYRLAPAGSELVRPGRDLGYRLRGFRMRDRKTPRQGLSSRITELGRLSKHQRLVVAVFAIWGIALTFGLFGGSVGLPRALTAPAGAIALIALFWFMPGGYLYVLLVERRRGAIRTKGLGALAIRRRWYFAFSGSITVVVGLILLIPSTPVMAEIRLAGAVILVWGLLALSVFVLAIQMKLWLADPQLTQ